MDKRLLEYLQGKISFSEWLDGATSESVEQQGGISPRGSTSSSTLPYNQGARGFEDPSASLSTSIANNPYQAARENDTGSKIIQQSSRLQESKDGSDDEYYEPQSTSNYEEDEWEGSNEDEDGMEGSWPIANESDLMDDSDPSQSKGKVPKFCVPSLPTPSDGASLATSFQTLHHLVTRLSEALEEVSKTAGTGVEDPSVTKVFADFIFPKQRRLRKSGPSSHKLREDLRQQMGMANLFLAKGQIDDAIEVCMEIIRQAPHNPHAFKTLSVIYEEKGDAAKSLQYALISAFLGSRDPHEWRDLAIRCLQSGSRKQALICYTNGCKVARHNIVLQWERAALFFEDGDYKKALECYNTILKVMTFVDGGRMIDFGKEMAQIHHMADNSEKAIEILEALFEKYPDRVDFEGVNMLAELHISSKNFERSLQVIRKYAGVQVPESLLSSSSKSDESFAENAEEGPDIQLPPKMIESINSLLDQGQTVNSNVEFTTQFAKSLVQERQPEQENSEAFSSKTTPSSWTEFLLSSSKNSAEEEDVRQAELVDLDKVTNEAKGKVADEKSTGSSEKLFIPDHVPVDIRVKIAVSAIEMRICFDVQHVLFPLLKESVEDVGDLYLDIAEAYINVGRCEDAIWYLERLTQSVKYSKAAVWLKLAECRQALQKLPEAVDAYYKVLELAPDQLGVTLELSNLCRRMGRAEEARSILAGSGTDVAMNDNNSEPVVEITKKDDFKLWYQKCILLHGQGQMDSLAESGYIFFINYFRSAAITRDDGISKTFVWELLLKVLKAMVSLELYNRACEIIDKSTSFRFFSENKRYRCELEFLNATTSYLAKDYVRAFDAFRWALLRSDKKALKSASLWNFFCRITNNMPDRKAHKYVLRQLFKHPSLLPLIIVNGHNSFLCGSYKYALGEYIRAFRMKPKDPMLSLCIGITYLHLACQRFTKHRHTSVLQGIAFMLQYYNMRGKSQEACYNLARAFHQVGLVHFSVIFYNKALNFPLSENEYSELKDLHREAAYNLALIYKNSGNVDLARRTLYKYIWV